MIGIHVSDWLVVYRITCMLLLSMSRCVLARPSGVAQQERTTDIVLCSRAVPPAVLGGSFLNLTSRFHVLVIT